MTSKNMEARRAAFELHFQAPVGVLWNHELEHYSGGHYWWLQQERWLSWNAALDSICVELPQPMPSDDPYASYEGGWNDMRSEVQDALTAAGVHYK